MERWRSLVPIAALALALGAADPAAAEHCAAGYPCVADAPSGTHADATDARLYQSGLSEDEVRAVQLNLILTGFYSGYPNMTLDGPTHDAIRAFQVAEGLPATGDLAPGHHALLQARAQAVWDKLGFVDYMNPLSKMSFSYPTRLLDDVTEDDTGSLELHSADGIGVYLWPFIMKRRSDMERYRQELVNSDFPGFTVLDSHIYSDATDTDLGFSVDAVDDTHVRYDEFALSASDPASTRLHGFSIVYPKEMEGGSLFPRLRHFMTGTFSFFDSSDPPTGPGIPLPY